MVSIAMAVYNGANYLDKQLSSILNQLDPEDELVVSYDVSKDNTYEILEKWAAKDHRIKLLSNKHPGITNNFNNALINCKGDVVCISDQDDIWYENKISTIKQLLIDNDVVFHNFAAIDKDDNVIFESFYENNKVDNSKIRTFWRPRQSGCCMAFKSSFLSRFIPIPVEVESYDHWLAMMSVLYGKVVVENKPLIYHRYHDSNVTSRGTRHNVFSILRDRHALYKQMSLYKKKHK